MSLFKHLNKQTKVLLWILLAIVLIGAGVLTWAKTTGKLSSSADVINCSDCQYATIKGKVTFPNGTPLGGITVNLKNLYNPTLNRSVGTSSDGTFAFLNVPQQTKATNHPWSVTASYNDGCGVSTATYGISKFWVNGETINVVLLITGNPWAKGNVTRSETDLTPETGLSIYLYKISNDKVYRISSTKTDAKGNYKFTCVLIAGQTYAVTDLSLSDNSTVPYNRGNAVVFDSHLPGDDGLDFWK